MKNLEPNRQQLKKIVSHLRTYLRETNEEDFSKFKEVLMDKEKLNKKKNRLPNKTLEELYRKIKNCQKCPLSKTRINLVFGIGPENAQLIFIGEGPGYEEDRKGEPFVGRAGELLNKIISAMKMKREEVYIANIVKCHPLLDPKNPEKRGNDRAPRKEEIQICLPILEEQIRLIKPKIICTLGLVATQTLLGVNSSLNELRGKFYDYQGISILPTYHPAALLRNPELKKPAWDDFKKVINALNR